MLQVARLSPGVLGDAADLTARFLSTRLNPDGGFQDRSGASDLYYTVFGLEGLIALRRDLPVDRVRPFLAGCGGDPAALDFVHAACLARCWADLGAPADAPAGALLARIEAGRTPDGGYNATPGARHGTAYGGFLALGAYEDLGAALPAPDRLADSLDALRTADGGYGNQPGAPTGLTPPTAAAVTLRRRLGRPDLGTGRGAGDAEGLRDAGGRRRVQAAPDVQAAGAAQDVRAARGAEGGTPGVRDLEAGQGAPAVRRATDWLLARHLPAGGFCASPATPLPDLLSTATALHALVGAHADIASIREPCLDFIDSLWSNSGGFYGSWGDDAQDCEYAFYALLALGHLS